MKNIIKKIRDGDENAFKELTLVIQNDLYRIARTRLKNDEDIKDAIQNTMIITYKSVNKIKNVDSFKYWMIHVLINECNKIYNLNKKNIEIIDKSLNDSELSINLINEINSKLDFERILDVLNYEEKIVITLYYNSQFTCRQISKLLGININTVKSRLLRGKKKIKNIYKEELQYDL